MLLGEALRRARLVVLVLVLVRSAVIPVVELGARREGEQPAIAQRLSSQSDPWLGGVKRSVIVSAAFNSSDTSGWERSRSIEAANIGGNTRSIARDCVTERVASRRSDPHLVHASPIGTPSRCSKQSGHVNIAVPG